MFFKAEGTIVFCNLSSMSKVLFRKEKASGNMKKKNENTGNFAIRLNKFYFWFIKKESPNYW